MSKFANASLCVLGFPVFCTFCAAFCTSLLLSHYVLNMYWDVLDMYWALDYLPEKFGFESAPVTL
jgi:hypothetical protein